MIPPVKLYRKGELNEDLLDLILHQVGREDSPRSTSSGILLST